MFELVDAQTILQCPPPNECENSVVVPCLIKSLPYYLGFVSCTVFLQ